MRNAVTILLAVLTVAKVVAVLALGPAPIIWDAVGYWRLSRLVVAGDWLMIGDPIAYRTPGYPWLLALGEVFNEQNKLLAIVALQGTMFVLSVFIAGRIAGIVTRSNWALPLTLLISLPTLSAFTYSATLLTESLFTLLLMLNLWAMVCYAEKPRLGTAFFVGTTFAAALLTRPVVLYLWACHLVFVAWSHKSSNSEEHVGIRRPPRTLLHLLTAVVVVTTLVAPWINRNQQLFGHPFLTEFLGRNIWIVTFQDGSGAGLDFPESEAGLELSERLPDEVKSEKWRSTWTISRSLVASGLSDPAADRLMRRVSFDAIKNAPGIFAYKAIRRTANFWRCAVTDLPEQGKIGAEYMGMRSWSWQAKPVAWLIDHRLSRSVAFNTLITTLLGVAVMILIWNRDTRRFGIWVAMIFGYFAVVTGLVEIPNYRYRMILEPLSAATAACATIIAVSHIYSKRKFHQAQ